MTLLTRITKKATLKEALRKSYKRERVGGRGDRLFIGAGAYVIENRTENRQFVENRKMVIDMHIHSFAWG